MGDPHRWTSRQFGFQVQGPEFGVARRLGLCHGFEHVYPLLSGVVSGVAVFGFLGEPGLAPGWDY